MKKCPECGKNKLIKGFGVPFAKVQGNPRSLGVLAEENTKRKSVEQMQLQEEEYINKKSEALEKMGVPQIKRNKKDKTKKEKMDKLNKMNDQQKKDYILTGKGA